MSLLTAAVSSPSTDSLRDRIDRLATIRATNDTIAAHAANELRQLEATLRVFGYVLITDDAGTRWERRLLPAKNHRMLAAHLTGGSRKNPAQRFSDEWYRRHSGGEYSPVKPEPYWEFSPTLLRAKLESLKYRYFTVLQEKEASERRANLAHGQIIQLTADLETARRREFQAKTVRPVPRVDAPPALTRTYRKDHGATLEVVEEGNFGEVRIYRTRPIAIFDFIVRESMDVAQSERVGGPIGIIRYRVNEPEARTIALEEAKRHRTAPLLWNLGDDIVRGTLIAPEQALRTLSSGADLAATAVELGIELSRDGTHLTNAAVVITVVGSVVVSRKIVTTSRPSLAPNSVVARFGPHMNGPLPANVARTFRGGSYSEIVLGSETTLYRVYGGGAGKVGPYWTRVKPGGPLQSQLDSALVPAWGNTAENVVSIRVPAGTTIFEGAAAPQATGVGQLLGGGNQVYIPRIDPRWIIP